MSMTTYPSPYDSPEVRELWDKRSPLIAKIRASERKHGLSFWGQREKDRGEALPKDYQALLSEFDCLRRDEDRAYDMVRRRTWQQAAGDLKLFLKEQGGSATFTEINILRSSSAFRRIGLHKPENLADVPGVEVRRGKSGLGHRVWLVQS